MGRAINQLTLAKYAFPPADGWRHRLDKLQAIYDLTEALTRAEALESIYEIALRGICETLSVERASILLFDAAGVMRFKAWQGLSSSYREAVEGHTPWMPTTTDAEPVLVSDVTNDPGLSEFLPVFKREGIGSLGFFPLTSGGRVAGKFMVYYPVAHHFGEEEARLAMTISNHVSIALERRLHERGLAESEARYRNIVETANEGVLVLDEKATITVVNCKLTSMLGYEAEELIGRPLFDLMDREWKKKALGNLRRRRKGVREQFDFRFRHKDGSPVWAIVNAAPFFDADGAYAGSFTFVTNITGRKASEERYRALAEGLPQLVLMAPPDGAVTYCNKAWTDYTGIDLEETRAIGWPALLHPDDLARVSRKWREIQTTREIQIETRIRRSDGQYRWHQATARPIHLPDGTIEGWLYSATDIHDTKRAQERERFLGTAVGVLASSLDFETTLQNLADLIVPEIADLCVIYMRETEDRPARRIARGRSKGVQSAAAGVRIWNWRLTPGSSELVRDRLGAGETLLVGDVNDEWLDGVADSEESAKKAKLLGATSFIAAPLKVRNKGLGSLAMVLTTPGRHYDNDDLRLAKELAHRVAGALDNALLYEESQKIAERLSLANMAKDEFLGLVSHEMRTPITTIYGNAQVLQRLGANVDEDSRGSALADIEHDAERLQRIIENMLILARIGAGEHVNTEPVLLNRVLIAAGRDFESRSPGRALDLMLPEEGLTVLARPTYLELILRNLLGNAHKFGLEGTPIGVRAVTDGGDACVCVMDRGPGTRADDLERIFLPFYRSADAEAVPGAGMGLAVCRRLVEAQGGKIWAQSRDGGGLCICFTLQLDSTQVPAGD